MVEKKNPYVTTVGFNKEDPDHVRVAELLNSMGRSKAQYIVKAVIAYQNMTSTCGNMNGMGLPVSGDYIQIKQMVYQILKELRENGSDLLPFELPDGQKQPEMEETEDNMLSGLDETAMSGILASIAAFQAQ